MTKQVHSTERRGMRGRTSSPDFLLSSRETGRLTGRRSLFTGHTQLKRVTRIDELPLMGCSASAPTNNAAISSAQVSWSSWLCVLCASRSYVLAFVKRRNRALRDSAIDVHSTCFNYVDGKGSCL